MTAPKIIAIGDHLATQLERSVQMMKEDPAQAMKRFRLTAEERADRLMSERTLYGRVKYRLDKFGWRFIHFTQAYSGGGDGRPGSWKTPIGGDAKGFPDLMMLRPGREIAFAELKKELGKLSPEQEEWQGLLRTLGYDCFVWRPSDLRTGVIERFLRDVPA